MAAWPGLTLTPGQCRPECWPGPQRPRGGAEPLRSLFVLGAAAAAQAGVTPKLAWAEPGAPLPQPETRQPGLRMGAGVTGPGDPRLSAFLVGLEREYKSVASGDLGWEEVRMSEQPAEKAQAHAKENRDLSFALDPCMAQSCMQLGPAGGGPEAATDQAEVPRPACSQTHKARAPGQPSTDGSGGRERVVWAVWFSVVFSLQELIGRPPGHHPLAGCCVPVPLAGRCPPPMPAVCEARGAAGPRLSC